MGSFGSFYSGEQKKKKKAKRDNEAQKTMMKGAYVPPQVEIIGKGKKKPM